MSKLPSPEEYAQDYFENKNKLALSFGLTEHIRVRDMQIIALLEERKACCGWCANCGTLYSERKNKSCGCDEYHEWVLLFDDLPVEELRGKE